MTTQIAIVLGIIVVMTISFFTELLPLGFTALMVPVLLQGFGILTAKEAWAGFSDTTIITWLGLFVISAAFAKTSITYRIRTFVRKNTHGSPVQVMGVILLGVTILGILTSSTAAIAAMTPILIEICKDTGLDEKRVMKSSADVCVWASVQCLPLGSTLTYLLLFNRYLSEAGTDLQYGLLDFTWIKLPMLFVLFGYYLLISKRFKTGEATATNLQDEVIDYSKYTDYTPKQEKIATIIFVANIILMVVASATNIVPVYLVTTALAGVTVGLKLMTQKEAMSSISWPVIFLVAGTLPLSTAINSSGTGDWLALLIKQALPGLNSHVVLAIAFCIVTAILTQFMSNSAVIAIFAPIAASMAINLGMDPRLVVAGVATGSIICFGTPMAGTAGGYVYGVCDFKMKQFVKIGWIPCVIMIVAFIIWAPFVLNMIY